MVLLADFGRAPAPVDREAVYMSFVRELWAFLRVRKKFWLLPIILMGLLFGALLMVAQSYAIAPFIYTLF